MRSRETKFTIVEQKMKTTMNEKSIIESESKVLKLNMQLEKLGDNASQNIAYKQLISNFREESYYQVDKLVNQLNEVYAK
jgi:hypothetical protein